jgi:DNA processing protein
MLHLHGRIPAALLGLKGSLVWQLHGSLPAAPRLAVVGSRAAHRQSKACIEPIVDAALAHGYALVSGGARGIDAEVHRVALARGAPQLAIVPCHPEAPYPPEHAELFAAIAAVPGSGVLFALPPGVGSCRGIFASRNALVVAAATALIVAEAAPRSGSWGTGGLALRRRVATAAVLGSAGCADLVVRGACALQADPTSMKAAVLAWLAAPGEAPAAASWPGELTWLAEALARAGTRGVGLDDLGDPSRACAALVSAEILGLVFESPPGRYHRRA